MTTTAALPCRAAGGCMEPGQTERDHHDGGWSPYFCRQHDEERIAYITRQVDALLMWYDEKVKP